MLKQKKKKVREKESSSLISLIVTLRDLLKSGCEVCPSHSVIKGHLTRGDPSRTQPATWGPRAPFCHRKFSEVRRPSAVVPDLTSSCTVFTWSLAWPQPERPRSSFHPRSVWPLDPWPLADSTLPSFSPDALLLCTFPAQGCCVFPKPSARLHRPWYLPHLLRGLLHLLSSLQGLQGCLSRSNVTELQIEKDA